MRAMHPSLGSVLFLGCGVTLELGGSGFRVEAAYLGPSSTIQ